MSQIETSLQKNLHNTTARNRHTRASLSWEFLIPRPLSFLSNTLFFCGGLFFAWLEGYRGVPPAGQMGPPVFAWPVLIIFGWFATQELLVQQAKYMWNDIRDHRRDQAIPANRTRFVTRRPLSRRTALLCGGRWALGLLLAAFLSPVLLAVVLAITILQIIYEQWVKPQASRYPAVPLMVVAAGTVFKCMGAALVLGWGPGDHRWWIYGLALFGTGLVYGSTLWRIEADYFAQRGWRLPRSQSRYFQEKGVQWLRVGSLVGVSACLLLLVDGALVWEIQQLVIPAKILSPLLLLFLLLIDYRFNRHTTYRQFNLLDWRK